MSDSTARRLTSSSRQELYRRPTGDGRPRALAVLIRLAYWAVSLEHLSVFPPVGEDEPWIAAPAHKLAMQGIYGSDLFDGYYGLDSHNYQHMPLFPVVQAVIFRVAGAGVLQMRFLPVACGLLVLALTLALGRQMRDLRIGTVAMVLLIGLRFGGGWEERTGIPLLDISRINRYDIAVPLFGMMALWAFNRAERRRRGGWYVLAGALVALSGLSHLYGVFWLPAFMVILFLRGSYGARWDDSRDEKCPTPSFLEAKKAQRPRRRGFLPRLATQSRSPPGFLVGGRRLFHRRAPYLLLTGFALLWLPLIAYVASGWTDFVGQMRFISLRFDVFNPHFFVDNMVKEIGRYRLMDLYHPSGRLRLARPGYWTAILGLPIAVGGVLGRGRDSPHQRAFALAVAFIIQASLFALLLTVKHYNYLIALFPLACLLLALVVIELWDRSSTWVCQGALVLLLGLTLTEGAVRIARRRAIAARTTPYDEFEAQVSACIPPDSLVLGLQHYWLGLRQHPYRTWLLPLLRTGYATDLDEPIPLDEALERLDPDVILLDRHIGGYLESLSDPAHPNHETYIEWQRFTTSRHAELAGVVEDDTYGVMRVYWVRGAAIEGHSR